ncbi:hypothetical protein [Faecalicatena contorta]|uniref:hypothetical protein n=1 Tax=Faecalicatena contorta TaxID=39482 RepID=UPI003216E21E
MKERKGYGNQEIPKERKRNINSNKSGKFIFAGYKRKYYTLCISQKNRDESRITFGYRSACRG